MADNDLTILESARNAAFELEKAYRAAVNNDDLDAMDDISPQLDAAEDALAAARLKLLEAGQLTGEADVTEMGNIRQEIENAADTQALIAGAIKLAALLRRFV